jgi:hypothetical protein
MKISRRAYSRRRWTRLQERGRDAPKNGGRTAAAGAAHEHAQRRFRTNRFEHGVLLRKKGNTSPQPGNSVPVRGCPQGERGQAASNDARGKNSRILAIPAISSHEAANRNQAGRFSQEILAFNRAGHDRDAGSTGLQVVERRR